MAYKRAFWACILALIISSHSFADTKKKDCVACGKNPIAPSSLPANTQFTNDLVSIANHATNSRAPASITTNGKTKNDYMFIFCVKLTNARDGWDVGEVFDYIKSTPYKDDIADFFSSKLCEMDEGSKKYFTSFNMIASQIYESKDIPEAIFDYLEENKVPNKEEIWKKMVNSESYDGRTTLDLLYQYTIMDKKYDKFPDVKQASEKVRTFLCSHGGTYKKYADKAKCTP